MIQPMPGAAKEVSLSDISYAVAYFVLPGYAYGRISKIEELCQKNPEAAGPFFYVMACQVRKIPPNRADAELFSWKLGSLDDQTDFFVMVHPKPPAVALSVAPYFSGIFRNRITQKVAYYVLGQTPVGGGTTLRSVTLNPMVNSNLGPGPEPDLDSFLATVAFRLST
jgi:hypothetical protein